MSLDGGWIPPTPGWVCAECSFDYDAIDPDSVGALLRSAASRFQAPLMRGLSGEDLDAIVRMRPEPTMWSPLEYACHVRDCLELYDLRIARALAEERPTVPPMGRNAVAVERDYNGQDRAQVLDAIERAAVALAARLSSIDGVDLDRNVIRGHDEMTAAWMARNVVHECTHHLLDIGRGLRKIRGR